MVKNDNFSGIFPAKLYTCNKCDYSTSKKSHYSEHLLTAKHRKRTKMITNDNFSGISGTFPAKADNLSFRCSCGKMYKFASGLSRHRLTCNVNNFNINSNSYLCYPSPLPSI